MSQFKKTFIKAEDIVPGRIYLASHYFNAKKITLQPCRVHCSTEHGWKRGKVELQEGQYGKFTATVNFIDPTLGHRQVGLIYDANDFYFGDITGHPTLYNIPANWASKQIEKVEAEMRELQRKLNYMKALNESIKQGITS